MVHKNKVILPRTRRSRAEYRDQLRDLAKKLGPGAKLPTTREMSARFDVDKRTLNDVLNELEAENVVVRKDRTGIYVSPWLDSRLIVLAIGTRFFRISGGSPFWESLWVTFINAAQARFQAYGESMEIHVLCRDERGDDSLPKGLANLLATRRVHGVLAVGVPNGVHDAIMGHQVPCVCYAGPGKYYVSHSSRALIHMGVDVLARLQCRRIAYWRPRLQMIAAMEGNGLMEDNPWLHDEEFLRAALDQHGLTFIPGLLRDLMDAPTEVLDPHQQQQGYDLAMRVFGENKSERPDGIVIMDDMMTLGALAALRHLGLRPGIDIHIATHANRESTVLFGYERELTLMEYDPMDVVQAMYAMLGSLMAGEEPARRHIIVMPTLRASTSLEDAGSA